MIVVGSALTVPSMPTCPAPHAGPLPETGSQPLQYLLLAGWPPLLPIWQSGHSTMLASAPACGEEKMSSRGSGCRDGGRTAWGHSS